MGSKTLTKDQDRRKHNPLLFKFLWLTARREFDHPSVIDVNWNDDKRWLLAYTGDRLNWRFKGKFYSFEIKTFKFVSVKD